MSFKKTKTTIPAASVDQVDQATGGNACIHAESAAGRSTSADLFPAFLTRRAGLT